MENETTTKKKGLRTSEMWMGLAGSATIVQVGSTDPDPMVRVATMIAVAIISAMYIWSRTKIKEKAV